jgi:hypothetical protein
MPNKNNQQDFLLVTMVKASTGSNKYISTNSTQQTQRKNQTIFEGYHQARTYLQDEVSVWVIN